VETGPKGEPFMPGIEDDAAVEVVATRLGEHTQATEVTLAQAGARLHLDADQPP